MSNKKKLHKWYIEPLNAMTNEVLARNQEFLSEENIFLGIKCEDGKDHRLWGCPNYRFISSFMMSRSSLGVIFKVWHQENNGLIRVWKFSGKKKVKLPVPAKDISTK